MDPFNTVLSLQAAQNRIAIPKAHFRHVYLSRRPLIIIGYHLAGDIGAPLALMWGTDRDHQPNIVVIPEPRNRQLRFEGLEVFGQAIVDYLQGFNDTTPAIGSVGRDGEICIDAPQIVVPNRSTAEWLFGIVGRFTRHLSTEGKIPAPAIVPTAGKHLSFFHGLMPGSSLVLCATELLSMHWQTGQLPAEDLNLAALLGWVDPGEFDDGVAAARAGELAPPAGPHSDPYWDAEQLTSLIAQWHETSTDSAKQELRAEFEVEIHEQLEHTWTECWRTLELTSRLPEASRVAARWERDRSNWTKHIYDMENGSKRYRNIPTPTQSANTLHLLEKATDDLKAEIALDDPRYMAVYVASGEALSGRVISIDADRKIQSNTTRQLRRPLITLEPLIPFTRPIGSKLFLTSAPEVKLEIINMNENLVHAQVNSGALTQNTFGRLPVPGEMVVLSPFGNSQFFPSTRVDDVPWTHSMPTYVGDVS